MTFARSSSWNMKTCCFSFAFYIIFKLDFILLVGEIKQFEGVILGSGIL